MERDELISKKVSDTLIRAASNFREDQKKVYEKAIKEETNPSTKWVLESLLENSEVAQKNSSPLCDDTGIPHLFLEVGKNKKVSGEFLESIQQGIAEGLQKLPGRPMAIKGNDIERLEQSGGLDVDPGAVSPAPIIIKPVEENVIRLYILMQGGGPEIRGKTYRVFHQHKLEVIIDEIVKWTIDEVSKLGCTPCIPAIGIGRTHFEATSLMIEAMIRGNFNKQSDIEKEITNNINMSNIGPLGLKGNNTALATFVNVGPQRASGVRIVSLRLCCCVEPRVASVLL
ncbi:fumarate hydratase [Tissierella sp. MSJ-40]|uniref:Fumarate hydratase n=1 Tax=Tissierella simiarum TaxID=2841534 RepID=A0ABS6E181_9FIRM|nr:fumarate hydratase [Tissierella simiarum]MBU5436652.1 fumarate hydratase [Tissierella simiarum]